MIMIQGDAIVAHVHKEMRKLKYHFEIPCKFFSYTADSQTPTQTLCVKGTLKQDIC